MQAEAVTNFSSMQYMEEQLTLCCVGQYLWYFTINKTLSTICIGLVSQEQQYNCYRLVHTT